MKKIMTKKDKEKRERRNKIILSLILVSVMLFSTAGYAFFQGSNEEKKKVKYKDIEFELQEDGLWHFSIEGYQFSTLFNPEQTQNASGFLTLTLQDYYNKPLYFHYKSNRQAVQEIARNLQHFIQRTQLACVENCEENLPVKNCSNNMIIIRERNKTLINQNNNCVYIDSKKEDVLKASDAFIYKLLKLNN